MSLPTDEKLICIALDALEELAAVAHAEPVRRTWALRLVLAFLATRASHRDPPTRWPFDQFWQSLEHGREKERWANVNAALNAIYLTLGRRRELERVTVFEAKARQRTSGTKN